MRAAVVVPPVRDFYFSPRRASAIGARTVCRVLGEAGWETVLFNFPLQARRPSALPLPAALGYLEPFILPDESGPTSFFTSWKRFGPDDGTCVRSIVAAEPDAVFFSLFAYAYAESALSLARALRETAPRLPLFIGGAGYTALPERFLATGLFEAGIPGEAETALPPFLERHAGRFPARHPDGLNDITPVIAATGRTKRGFFVSTSVSRGCPRACAFCSNHLVQGRKFRTAPLERVRAELDALTVPEGTRLFFNFEDDNLLIDRDYLFAVMGEVRSRHSDTLFSAENGLDYLLLDDGVLDRLIDAGFRQFNLSLAAVDPAILAGEHRSGDPRRLGEVCTRAAARGVPSVVYFIAGLPGDTPAGTVDALRFVAGLPALCGISPFYAVPGIDGFENPERFADLPPILCAGSACHPWTGTLTTAQLVTAFRLSRFSNLEKAVAAAGPGGPDGVPRPQAGNAAAFAALAARCHRERRLLTIWRGETVEPPGLDGTMVERFLADAYPGNGTTHPS